MRRLALMLTGRVQGVGFRPFVHRLAQRYGLSGFVRNDRGQVAIEVEGPQAQLAEFVAALERDKPGPSRIDSLQQTQVAVRGDTVFSIVPGAGAVGGAVDLLPDLALCSDCRRELLNPADRRYRYPFINCTQCGPRYSIITAFPYDRANTTMAGFALCDECRREYHDPQSRRFHAQAIACPACGPQLEWRGSLSTQGNEAALTAAGRCLQEGGIVAVKGLGGFHLAVDAGNEAAVAELRRRKQRPHKPFAVMFEDPATLRDFCAVSAEEERLLCGREAPIVLLQRSAAGTALAAEVAPGLPWLGAMLPYTPLHLLLLKAVGRPLVMTSGNRGGEPLCVGNAEALQRLGALADGFLLHDRPIHRAVDDSLLRVAAGAQVFLRRARGFAPYQLRLPRSVPPTLAAGADLKSTVALAAGEAVTVSHYLGDLANPAAARRFASEAGALATVLDIAPRAALVDAHPGYHASCYGRERFPGAETVQHHRAHVRATQLETDARPPFLGLAWDGTGHGDDASVWGGEFFLAGDGGTLERIATLRPFRLPGGEAAIREPWRIAFSLLHELEPSTARARLQRLDVRQLSDSEQQILKRMLSAGLNSPWCSSAGRLFDGVAALLGLLRDASFEAQAAMLLEAAAQSSDDAQALPWTLERAGVPWQIDWRPALVAILQMLESEVPNAVIARRFHHMLAAAAVTVAQAAGQTTMLVGGGCFQNKLLVESLVQRARLMGITVRVPRVVPPNDEGIALGQIGDLAMTGGNPET